MTLRVQNICEVEVALIITHVRCLCQLQADRAELQSVVKLCVNFISDDSGKAEQNKIVKTATAPY